MRSYPVRENPIGSVVNEIFRYKQTDIVLLCILYWLVFQYYMALQIWMDKREIQMSLFWLNNFKCSYLLNGWQLSLRTHIIRTQIERSQTKIIKN